jgi:hypothetical protein
VFCPGYQATAVVELNVVIVDANAAPSAHPHANQWPLLAHERPASFEMRGNSKPLTVPRAKHLSPTHDDDEGFGGPNSASALRLTGVPYVTTPPYPSLVDCA